MASLNKVMIIGNLGSEPEMRFTPNGNPVTSFRVATNRVYTTPEGERRQETEWFKQHVRAFDPAGFLRQSEIVSAEVAPLLHDGVVVDVSVESASGATSVPGVAVRKQDRQFHFRDPERIWPRVVSEFNGTTPWDKIVESTEPLASQEAVVERLHGLGFLAFLEGV